MTIRLYIDEDSMSRALARALEARGVDVTTALSENMIEQPDIAHLDYATQQGRVLYSFNVRDFHNLHTLYLAQGRHHHGIILAPQQRYSVGEQMRRLLKLIATKSSSEMNDSIEFLSSWG
ncbi:MAG: DUF5615 family PIN-like protein [Anaerolineae bacterium]